MRPAIHDASARQRSGGPALVPDRGGNRDDGARKPAVSDVEGEIAGLLDRSTPELRLAWRQLHRTGPPVGLSRDLLIRALAYDLQARAHGGASAALRRRLQSLAEASEKGAVDRGIVLKAGTTLVRQWRGHTHTVLRAGGRVRTRGPALSFANGNCRADYRGPLVGSPVLWPG